MKLTIIAKRDLHSTTEDVQDIEIEFDFEQLDGYVICKVGYEENLFVKCDDLRAVLALLSIRRLVKIDD